MAAHRRILRSLWLPLTAGALALAGASLFAQPEAQPQREPDAANPARKAQPDRNNRPRPALSNDPAEFRKYLQRRAEASRRMQQKLDEAMAQLDKGADPAEIRRSLEQAAAENLAGLAPEGGGQRPGMEGPGGPPSGQGMGGPGPDGPAPGAGGPPNQQRPQNAQNAPLSPDEREQLRNLLRENRPELLKQLEAMAPRDPAARDRLVSGLGRFRDLLTLQKRDKTAFEFRLDELKNTTDVMQATREVYEAKKAGANDSAALDKARVSLRAAIAEQFDLKIRSLQRQLDQFKQRSERLQKEVTDQKERRERIIDEHVAKIMNGPGDPRRKPEGGNKQPPPNPPTANERP
ncbi:MAG: hypothetical protein ACREJO_10115 [Phycisphaerales bacterium]